MLKFIRKLHSANRKKKIKRHLCKMTEKKDLFSNESIKLFFNAEQEKKSDIDVEGFLSKFQKKLKRKKINKEYFTPLTMIFNIISGSKRACYVYRLSELFDCIEEVKLSFRDDALDIVYLYLFAVSLAENKALYNEEMSKIQKLFYIPREVRKKWPNIVIQDSDKVLSILAKCVNKEVIELTSKELGGQGEGVIGVRRHDIKTASGERIKIVEKIVDLGFPSSEAELKAVEFIAKEQASSAVSLPFPEVHSVIKEYSNVARFYMEYKEDNGKEKKDEKYFMSLAKSAARFNYSLRSDVFHRNLDIDKKLQGVLEKLNKLGCINSSTKVGIEFFFLNFLSNPVVKPLENIVSHGDVHLRNTIYEEKVFFIDYGGFVMAPAGHDLNFLLWVYAYRMAEIKGAPFWCVQNMFADVYVEETFSVNKKLGLENNRDLFLSFILLISCISWLSRALKKKFVLDYFTATTSYQLSEGQVEWVKATEYAVEFLAAKANSYTTKDL